MKKWLSIVALALMVFASNATAKYPERPIEMVIPFGEGSASDIFVRKFAELLSTKLPQPVQAINKKGGGGLIGMVYAAQQRNDGYTILEITPSHVIADVLGTAPVKLMRDFEPLARIQSDMYILGVQKNSKFKSFQDIVKYGRQHEITFAGVSPGGLDDMTLAALADATNMKIKFIPYKSGSEVKAAVLGGEVDIYLDKVISAVNYIKDGSVRPMVVLSDKRIDAIDVFKNVPTTVELGYNVTIGSWRGFVVRKGTPKKIKELLTAKMKEVYDSKEYQAFAAQTLTNIAPGYLDAKGFKKQWEAEYQIFDPIAKKIGLKK
jgi:putative tricarboxylic transport membrane protein